MRRWLRPARDIGLIAACLLAVSFLPSDTSLRDRQKAGMLRYCVADATSPLLRDPQSGGSGPELALVQAASTSLGLELRVVEAKNIGRAFNPADWNISRGQCDILGGGFADSAVNRGFMTLLPTGAQIALEVVGAAPDLTSGAELGVFMGSHGLDRVRLSRWMREQGVRAVPLRNRQALDQWLAEGRAAVVSSLTDLPPDLARQTLPEAAGEVTHLAIGLWRGETTFTRAFRNALAEAQMTTEIR